MSTAFLAAGAVLLGINRCIYTVDPGERALIMDNFSGLSPKVYEEGYHLYFPFIQVISIL
jgi:prohibitin 1